MRGRDGMTKATAQGGEKCRCGRVLAKGVEYLVSPHVEEILHCFHCVKTEEIAWALEALNTAQIHLSNADEEAAWDLTNAIHKLVGRRLSAVAAEGRQNAA
jgi:hypothetical protein